MRKKKRRLTEEARFAAFAELLARPEEMWGEVMMHLSGWPADQQPERAIAMAEAAADRWSPVGRRLTRSVVHKLEAGDVGPYLRLLRNVDLRLLWRVRRRDRLFERMIVEGGVRELHEFTTRYDHGEPLVSLVVRHIVGLRVLFLGMSGIGTAGARAIASAPSLAGLHHLSLHNNPIDDAGAEALLESPYLGGLHYLNLYDNMLSPRMVERILAAPQWRSTGIVIHGQWEMWRDPG